MLKVESLSGGYSGRTVVRDISFEVPAGNLFGILGPNGSGKTTLLKIISGVLGHEKGSVWLKGKLLAEYSPRDLARVAAVLSQHSSEAFSYTVKETVALGRYAHKKGLFHYWSEEDEKVVQTVMQQTGTACFENQPILQLSGGERQRVFLAQALAQQPEILLLDEPTNHLDLSYQKELLDLLKQWTRDQGLTVISIFHDLNLASLYCDRLLLLHNGEVRINHTPNEVLKEKRIEEVYGTAIEKLPHPKVPKPQMALIPAVHSEDRTEVRIDEGLLAVSEDLITLTSPIPLRTMSSGVAGSGTGWYQTFVNRHVSKDYDCSDHRKEMASFLQEKGFEPVETVAMMTAVRLEDVSWRLLEGEGLSVFIVVTAGVGNAVDASLSSRHANQFVPGTINTWIFVNGKLTEEAFIQSIMTATEAKVKVMHDQRILDSLTGTTATGTSTDSILIASTQRGLELDYAGTITPLGKLIGSGVYECTAEAIQNSRKRFEL